MENEEKAQKSTTQLYKLDIDNPFLCSSTLGHGKHHKPGWFFYLNQKNTPKGVLILRCYKEFLFRSSLLTSWWRSSIHKEPLDFTIFDFAIDHL